MTRAALVLLVLLVAGCTQPASTTQFKAAASKPVVFLGYDYPGLTAQPGEGSFAVDVDTAAKTGSAVAQFTWHNQAWRVAFSAFHETRPFQQGGLRADFPEHGSTGNGDANLPRLHALSAGWGTGTVTVDGQPLTDPLTGNATFALHYMVTDTAPRDPENYKVLKADGNATYDPAMPDDARVRNGTLQALLNVQSTAPAPPPDNVTVLSDTINDPSYQKSKTFDVAGGANVTINFTATNPTPLPTVGKITFSVADPGGKEVAHWDYDPTVGGAAGRGTYGTVLAGPLAAGTYNLQVAGPGVQVTYSASASVVYQKPLFVHVAFLDVHVG